MLKHDLSYFRTRSTPVTESGCWLWNAGLNVGGYVQISITKHGRFTKDYGHRLVYTAVHGAIPDGMTIDHLCKVRCCVNPAHLEVVTRAVNTSRASRQTHCDRGHLFSEETSYHYQTKNGLRYRKCKQCNTITHRAYMQRQTTGY